MVWNDPGDGAPKTVAGRFALAHVRGEKIDGVPVTALMVAQKVAAALRDRHPVEAYIEPTSGALEYLRDDVRAAVAT